MSRLAPIAIAFLCAACDGGPREVNDLGADLAVADLSAALGDLSTRPDQAGINCASSTCKTGAEVCCVEGNGPDLGYSQSCTTRSACPMGATPLGCDGPEDCSGSAGGCCATISGTGYVDAGTATSGQAVSSCANVCMLAAVVDQNGNFSAQTRLCHASSDCVGLMGTISAPGIGMSTQPFTACCMQAQAGPYTFCAPPSADGVYGVSCPTSIN